MEKKKQKPTLKPLTRKQKAFVQHLIDNPKASGKAAAKVAYNTTTDRSAEVIASELLRKPDIKSHLAMYSNDIENGILATINRYKNSDELDEVKEAMLNSRWIHDKIHGKATQKIEQRSTVVEISMDLSGD